MHKTIIGSLALVSLFTFAWADPALFNAKFKQDVKEAKAKLEIVSPEKVDLMMEKDENFIILDVRDYNELVAIGRPDWKFYKNISRGRLELFLGNSGLNIDDRILVICKTSTRSALAAATLKEYGFQNIMLLEGGMDAWTIHNMPEVKELPRYK